MKKIQEFIKPKIEVVGRHEGRIPFFCPSCGDIMNSIEDINSFKQYNYCSKCCLYGNSNKEKK